MKFTFGIITQNTVDNRVIDSILSQEIPKNNYEIIIVGGSPPLSHPNIKHFGFDDSKNFTIKKNLITKSAQFENIVFMHDYYYLKPGWYEGFCKFGNNWDICMNIILNQDNTRFRDWIICYDREYELRDFSLDEKRRGKPSRLLPPYTYNKIENMYISGGYWVAKKQTMLECPLDETLNWGESEDYEWSERVIWNKKYSYQMNTNSTVSLLKQKRLSAELI